MLDSILLPSEQTPFERRYLARMNAIALWFFVAHIPFLAFVAWLNSTGPLKAALATSLGVIGPMLARQAVASERTRSVIFGITAMFMGALLVHFGRGLWTIEMHFYFFVALALLAVFANPMVIIVAAATVALHHLALWFVAPHSVFNYDAPLSSVLVHALFVVLESVAACFVARSFFDNVIGLERIVAARTSALDGRNREMALVFQHVDQGLFTTSLDGAVRAERSAIVDQWLSVPSEGERVWDWFGRVDGRFAQWLKVGWQQVVDDVMPRDVSLAMLPQRLTTRVGVVERVLEVRWQTIEGPAGRLEALLAVVSDITERVLRERADVAQRETLAIFGALTHGRAGFLEFLSEGRSLIQAIRNPGGNEVERKRHVHTLKGNAALFGFSSVAQACQVAESRLDDQPDFAEADLAAIVAAWESATRRASQLIDAGHDGIEIAPRELDEVVAALDANAPSSTVKERLNSWRHEPLQRRFERLGEQARTLAKRLDKGDVTIETRGSELRIPVEPFAGVFAALPHVVRNAVDHGLESSEARAALGKPARLVIACERRVDAYVLSVADNGAGIDWSGVATLAAKRGLKSQTRADLVEALCADGLTTRAVATDVSGRGVGMAAVRAACLAAGGHLEVTSEAGQGTRIELHLPLPTASHAAS